VVVVVVETSVAVLRVIVPSVVPAAVLGVAVVPVVAGGCAVASPGVVCVVTLPAPAAPVGAVFVF
jgi:hypothetical protein